MSAVPTEPEAFAEFVANKLRDMRPSYAIELIGPRELIVNSRRLDLENVFRMVAHEPDRGTDIIEHYLDQLFSPETEQLNSITIDFARPRIMPRIQPESLFEHLNRELVAHVPFVNNTVIVFVTDLPHMTVSITTEQMVRWGICADELEEVARQNLDRYAPQIEVQLVESKEGGRAAILSEQDGYDAARLLLSGLHARLASQLGNDFLVATPARDMFVALSNDPPIFVNRLRDRVAQDYTRLPYPITDQLFLVTRDGVAGTLREAA